MRLRTSVSGKMYISKTIAIIQKLHQRYISPVHTEETAQINRGQLLVYNYTMASYKYSFVLKNLIKSQTGRKSGVYMYSKDRIVWDTRHLWY